MMAEGKRICFVQTSCTYYGAERSLAAMAKYLVRRGWGVKVVSLAPGDAFAARGPYQKDACFSQRRPDGRGHHAGR